MRLSNKKIHTHSLRFSVIIALSVAALMASSIFDRLYAADQPNVVVILADDFGYGSTNAYGAPESLVRTPNIDRIAKEGRRFTNAYTASSVCSPTRYALLTGRYCFRTSLTHGVLNTFAPLHIGEDQLNVASLLKQHGYETAAIGKWHLGYGNAMSSDARTDYAAKLTPGPLDIGFSYHFGVPSNHGDRTGVFVENYYTYGLQKGRIAEGDYVGSPAQDDPDFQSSYSPADTEANRLGGIEISAPRRKNDAVMNVLTSKTVRWLEKQSPEKPFFLYFTPVAVHNPVTPSNETKGKSAAGIYGDWIHELDRSVGAVLDALDRKGLAENTIVVFTSDNGGVFRPNNPNIPQTKALEAGLKVNGILRGGKHTVFEGGFRVPYLVRWPDKVQANSVSNEIISLADTLATLSAVVGHELPPAKSGAQDSYNVLSAWTNDGSAVNIRRDVVVHSADGVFAIRKGDWKWIEGVPDSGLSDDSRNRADNFKPQLYNLADDPSETKDVIDQNPAIAAELKDILDSYRTAGFSRDKPTPTDLAAKTPVQNSSPSDGVAGSALKEPVTSLPSAPWTTPRGTWTPRDGALYGKSQGNQAASLRVPLTNKDFTVQFDVQLEELERQTVRIETTSRQRAFRFDITPSAIAIIKNDNDGQGPDKQEEVAKKATELAIGSWHHVEIQIRGDLAKITVDDFNAEGSHTIVDEAKSSATWLVFGGEAGLKNIVFED